MQINKTYITLVACALINISAQDKTNAIKHDNRSSTKIIQTYRFDELLDDGSYTIKIENLSSNVNILGHEGSGAKVVIRNIAQIITEQEAQEAYEHSKTIVKNFKDEEMIHITGSNNKMQGLEMENFIDLNLPKNINLEINLLGGDISIDNIHGKSILESLGGDININNHDGRVDTKTNAGDIKINKVNGVLKGHSFGGNIYIAESNGDLASSTVGGDIFMEKLYGIIGSQTSGGSINLLDVHATEINCKSIGGAIKCNNISGKVKIQNSGKGINIENSDGDLEIKSNSGDITINKSNGSLKCEGSFGNIIMKEISGDVKSISASGDILLELIYDSSIDGLSIHLETHSGDISLNIPKRLPINLKGTVFQSLSDKDINSEIPLDVYVLKNKVVGTKKFENGDIPINLEVHKGIITIKES
tara:strand:- start:647 stop:1903 length:1257 start_codon:yes stop_codon:yes gene_type:complete